MNIIDYLHFRHFFSLRVKTKAVGIFLKTNWGVFECINIRINLVFFSICEFFWVFADIEMLIILVLLWLQCYHLFLIFDFITIKKQDSSFIVTDCMNDSLDFNFMFWTLKNFLGIQLQLKTLKESLEETIIFKEYWNLRSVFSQSNASWLLLH